MKDLRKWEIRRILMGYIDYDEAQNILASERSSHLRLMGLLNGSGAARILGLGIRTRHYSISASADDAMESCYSAFSQMGRFVMLDSEPELLSVFYAPILFNPAILTARMKDDILELTVYTARTLTVRWNVNHAFRQWRLRMPEGIREREQAEMPKERAKKEKQPRKLRRKATVRPFAAAAPEPEPNWGAEPDSWEEAEAANDALTESDDVTDIVEASAADGEKERAE